MTRGDNQRLLDILAAPEAIKSHLDRGNLSDGLIFNAPRIRLIEIGEAVKYIPVDFLSQEPSVPWQDVAGL